MILRRQRRLATSALLILLLQAVLWSNQQNYAHAQDEDEDNNDDQNNNDDQKNNDDGDDNNNNNGDDGGVNDDGGDCNAKYTNVYSECLQKCSSQYNAFIANEQDNSNYCRGDDATAETRVCLDMTAVGNDRNGRLEYNLCVRDDYFMDKVHQVKCNWLQCEALSSHVVNEWLYNVTVAHTHDECSLSSTKAVVQALACVQRACLHNMDVTTIFTYAEAFELCQYHATQNGVNAFAIVSAVAVFVALSVAYYLRRQRQQQFAAEIGPGVMMAAPTSDFALA